MKYVILKEIKNNNLIDYQKFVNRISHYKRNIPLIKENSFDIKILATAAPFCYASIIANNEQFHVCLGTDFPKSSFNNKFENIKEVKKNNIISYLTTINSTNIDVLVTDHLDDLPLIKLAKKNIIVKPNNHTISMLKQHNISFEVIY